MPSLASLSSVFTLTHFRLHVDFEFIWNASDGTALIRKFVKVWEARYALNENSVSWAS